MIKINNWQKQVNELFLQTPEEEQTVKEQEYLTKIKNNLSNFFETLENTNLEILEKHSNLDYTKLKTSIAHIQSMMSEGIGKEQLRQFYYLVNNSYKLLIAARRELLPLQVLDYQQKIDNEQEKIISQTSLIQQVKHQIEFLIEEFTKYNVNKLELYAPQLWDEIYEEFNFVVNTADKTDSVSLEKIKTSIPQLIHKLEEASFIAKEKEEEVNSHLVATKIRLDKLIEKIASLNFPLFIAHEPDKCEEILQDLEKINTGFFINQSSPAIDYKAAHARMDDAEQLLALAVPTLKSNIEKQQQENEKKQLALIEKIELEKENSQKALNFLTKKRLIAMAICMPFFVLLALIIGAINIFKDILFMYSDIPLKSIFHLYHTPISYIWWASLALGIVGICIIILLRRLFIKEYSLKQVRQSDIYKPFTQRKNFIIGYLLQLCIFIAFIVVISRLCATQINQWRVANIQQLANDSNINQSIHLLSHYSQHPEAKIAELASETLFDLCLANKSSSDVDLQQYQQKLLKQQEWIKLAQLLSVEDFTATFIQNIDEQNINSALLSEFSDDILFFLLKSESTVIASLALDNLALRNREKELYYQMVFSFYHQGTEQKQKAIQYFIELQKQSWIWEILEQIKRNKDIATHSLFVKSLVKLAVIHPIESEKITTELMTINKSEKNESLAAVTTLGIAKIAHPASFEYLQEYFQTTQAKPLQIQILKAFAKFENPQVTEDIITLLCESEDYDTRKEAVYTLIKLGDKYLKLWKLIAKTKVHEDRNKILIKYSNQYKIVAAKKYLLKLATGKDKIAFFAKKTIQTILKHLRKQKKIAIVQLSSDNQPDIKALNLKITLNKQGYSTKVFSYLQNIPQADLVITTENRVISQESISQLMERNIKVLLLYSSAQVLGGTWGKDSTQEHRRIYLKPGLFSKIAKERLLQSQEQAFFINKPYPSGWVPDTGHQTGYTLLYKTDTNDKIQGIIFTYDSQYLTSEGEQVITKIIDILLEID